MAEGPYSIGSSHWSGLSKLVEELGELQQVLGKLLGTGGEIHHWDGTNLADRLVDEIGDASAAIEFFTEKNMTPGQKQRITQRMLNKLELFDQWHEAGDPLPDHAPTMRDIAGDEQGRYPWEVPHEECLHDSGRPVEGSDRHILCVLDKDHEGPHDDGIGGPPWPNEGPTVDAS